MNKVICFDLDGTIADFYNVPFWLDAIEHEETYPYRHAQPLIHFDLLAKLDRWKKGNTINADDTDALIEWIYNLIESEGL